jgi:hypothetical protein
MKTSRKRCPKCQIFNLYITDAAGNEFSEDQSFCLRARSLGFKIMADPTVVIGHIGEQIIYRKHYLDAHRIKYEKTEVFV